MVRATLLDLQRDLAKTANILMDGRDIGTTILPNAEVKIFLTASAKTVPADDTWSLQRRGEACEVWMRS